MAAGNYTASASTTIGDGMKAKNEDMVKWVQGWCDMMVRIWTARIEGNKSEFGVKWDPIIATGNLKQSVSGQKPELTFEDPDNIAKGLTAKFQFVLYGLYVDMGVGREFGLQKREGGHGMNRFGKGSANSMGGKFLPGQRGMKQNKNGRWSPTRQPRPWFSQAWGRSAANLVDKLEKDSGEQFVRIIDDLARLITRQQEETKRKAAANRKNFIYIKDHGRA